MAEKVKLKASCPDCGKLKDVYEVPLNEQKNLSVVCQNPKCAASFKINIKNGNISVYK